MARQKQQKIVISVEDKGDKQTVSMLFVPPLPERKEFDELRPAEKLLVNRAAVIGKYVRDIVSTLPEDMFQPQENKTSHPIDDQIMERLNDPAN